MEPGRRFINYAFCVGDVFVELDGDLRLVHGEGALNWLGVDDFESIKGCPLSQFLDSIDYKLLKSSIKLLDTSHRIGPIPVRMGTKPNSRRFVGLFLSRLPETNTVYVAVVAMSRLDGTELRHAASLPDPETFLNRLPALIAEGADSKTIFVVLVQLEHGDAPKDRDFFTRQLAALSLGGQSATELGGGRFALVREAGEDGEDANDFMHRLTDLTGEKLQVATLQSVSEDFGSDDTARALVYTVRKFADTRTEIDLKALSQNFSENLDDLRERIVNLRRLVKERRFRAAYQPIVSVDTGEIHHLEALVRFDTRNGSPFELIAFAEEIGMIGEFDMMMLSNVTNTLAHPADEKLQPRIAVNLSARSLTSTDFQASLMSHLARHHTLVDQLLIEVTESAQISDLAGLSEAVKNIRAAGFKICLDDFGAGASGFQYLKNIKADYVKIDGSYVRGAEHDPELRAFLHAMTTLCRDLGIQTIAEYVETEMQADLVRELGIDLAQGYFYGHPLTNLPNALRQQAQTQNKRAPRAAAS